MTYVPKLTNYTVAKQILGSHGGNDVNCGLLGCNTMYVVTNASEEHITLDKMNYKMLVLRVTIAMVAGNMRFNSCDDTILITLVTTYIELQQNFLILKI